MSLTEEKTKVLLIEDDVVDQMAFKRLVKECNLAYDYTLVGSVKEAKEVLSSKEFDVVITDHSLPDGKAFEVFELIIDTPIIFATGSGNERTAAQAVKIGAYDYLIKDPERNYLKILPITIENAIKRKRAEDEVKSLNEKLSRNVIQLQELNKELESFGYSVSHDLRAPLRWIQGFTKLLMEDCGPQLTPKSKEYFHHITSAVDRMSQLVDDLLKLSQIHNRALVKKNVDFTSMVHEVVKELRGQHPERKVEMLISPTPTAMCDESLFRIALENLIGNAWKFTGKTDAARVEFGSENQSGKTVYFIRDNGAGFNMAHAGKLFGTFERLHSGNDFPGTGIGLATVQRIIRRHGGRVWGEGDIGKGAVFYFTL
jgi:signal transduction histidine kinase